MVLNNKLGTLQIENERLKVQNSQLAEECHNHRQDIAEVAKSQKALEASVRDLCIHLLEYGTTYIDDDTPDWSQMDILDLIRVSGTGIDKLVQGHTDQIQKLLEMIRYYQAEIGRLREQ